MADLKNDIAQHRTARGWSQEQLARRTSLSRATISAIETGRVAPSTAAALVLADAFGSRVEDLFRLAGRAQRAEPVWAWPAQGHQTRFWRVSVGARTLLYPVERTAVGVLPAHGIIKAGAVEIHEHTDPTQSLVLAGCDPAVGLLHVELRRATKFQLIPVVRSSRQALELLQRGLVHVAGIHLQDQEAPDGNQRAVRKLLGSGYTLIRVTRWQDGVALSPSLRIRTIKEALSARLRWVAREKGSGARHCLEAIFRGRRRAPDAFQHVATDHAGVVEAIRTGWAQAGVCVRLPAAEAGLDFLVAREEDYDLCYRSDLEHDPRIQALVRAIHSQTFRRSLDELPGYSATLTGEQTHVRG